jgi:hypothetical protein
MNKENNIDSENFSRWVEKGWWTSQEAFCVLMGYPPQTANHEAVLIKLKKAEEGAHLIDLIAAAEIDGSVEGLVFAKPFYFYRASCKAWLEWALNKPSIQIIPELLLAVGIVSDKIPRSQESYRPQEEKPTKASFIASAKIVLFLCSKARLKDIKEVILQSKVLENLPVDRTLRSWIAEEGVVLNDTKISNLEIAEIERKLQIGMQSNRGINAFTSTLKS